MGNMRVALALCALCLSAPVLAMSFGGHSGEKSGPVKMRSRMLARMSAMLKEKQAELEKLDGVRGSKKLEEAQAAIPTFRLPFSSKERTLQKQTPAAARRALLQEETAPEFKFADSSSKCQETMAKAGYTDLGKVDSDSSYAPATPAAYEACEGYLQFVFDEAYGGGGTAPASGFCAQTCKGDSIQWVKDFASSCAMEAAGFNYDQTMKYVKATESGSDEEKVAAAFAALLYIAATGVNLDGAVKMDYYGMGAAVGCGAKDDDGYCAEQDYWWSAMQADANSGASSGDDDDDDSCPEWKDAAQPYVPNNCDETGWTPSDLSSSSGCDSEKGTSCCFMSFKSLDLASDSVIMCPMKDIMIKMGKDFDDPMPACMEEMMTDICDDPEPFLNGWTDRLTECCLEKGNPVENVCDGNPGDLIEKYLKDTKGRQLVSYGASWGPSFAGLVLALLLATGNAFA